MKNENKMRKVKKNKNGDRVRVNQLIDSLPYRKIERCDGSDG